MTNEQIILENSIFLMENGVIQPTDQMMVFVDGKGKREINVPEEIHTFQGWKKLGYQVQKGEKSVAKFPIWIYKNGKAKKSEKGEEEPETPDRCYMKMSFFFTRKQVKEIE